MRNKKNGYALIDVIVTIFIATFVLSSVIAGVVLVTHALGESQKRIVKQISDKNEMEQNRTIIFTAD
ncbi:MAG: hypothetical protein JW969_02000 [Spirochaetales bacterium]|nr:hypothetical protein [Spirochaetales bacterium]